MYSTHSALGGVAPLLFLILCHFSNAYIHYWLSKKPAFGFTGQFCFHEVFSVLLISSFILSCSFFAIILVFSLHLLELKLILNLSDFLKLLSLLL